MSAEPTNPLHHKLFQQPWPEGEYRFFQLGFIVDDLLPAAENWVRTFGIGPFHVLPRMQKLLDALEGLDDVQEVYTSAEIDE